MQVPVSLSLPAEFAENDSDDNEIDSVDLHKQPHLLVMGSLDEFQLSICGSVFAQTSRTLTLLCFRSRMLPLHGFIILQWETCRKVFCFE